MYGAERTTVDVAAALRDGPDPVDARILMIEETRLGLTSSPYRDLLTARGIPFTVVATPRRFSRALVAEIVRVLRENHVDILHCVGPKANVHGWLAARRVAGLAAVTTVHGWLARPGWKEKVYDRVEKALLKRFDAVIVLSRHYETWIRTLSVPARKIVRIPAGFAAGKWAPRPASDPDPERPFTIGMMARLSPEKNHIFLLEAVADLRTRIPSLRLILAGEGPDRSRLEQLIKHADLEDIVSLRGYMEPHEFHRKIDVAVLCSLLENLPYSMMEAMACGLPCVVTRAGGLPELVDDATTGYVVEQDDVSGLVRRLSKLAADRDLAQTLGQAGRKKLEREFGVSGQVDAHRRLYASLVARADAP